MDAWQPQQLKLMEVGGNAKCRNFFQEYGVWALPFKERYASKAAAYYRGLLRATADSSVPAPPLIRREEAAEPEAGPADSANSSFDSSVSPPIRALGSRQHQQQQDESLLATLQQQAAAASAAAAAAAASVSSNGGAAIDTALQSVSSFVSGAKEYTAKTLEAAGETGLVEKAKGGIQSLLGVTEEKRARRLPAAIPLLQPLSSSRSKRSGVELACCSRQMLGRGTNSSMIINGIAGRSFVCALYVRPVSPAYSGSDGLAAACRSAPSSLWRTRPNGPEIGGAREIPVIFAAAKRAASGSLLFGCVPLRHLVFFARAQLRFSLWR
ncbi:hypothetical protein Emag_007311 [Eimeria magna]